MIIAEYDNINSCGTKLLELSNSYSKELEKINNIITSLEDIWKGIDKNEYVTFLQEKCLPILTELNNVIKEYGDYIINVQESYKILDEIFALKKIEV